MTFLQYFYSIVVLFGLKVATRYTFGASSSLINNMDETVVNKT